MVRGNWPVPSYPVPTCQNESSGETIYMKMSSVHSLSFMQNKLIFKCLALHEDWTRFKTEAQGNSLSKHVKKFKQPRVSMTTGVINFEVSNRSVHFPFSVACFRTRVSSANLLFK